MNILDFGAVADGETVCTKVVEYSFGKYTKARVAGSAADANVFKWMMNYAYYLSQAFA